MKKIVLIDPIGSTLGINSGLGYLAGSLIKKGFNVRVLDFNNNHKNKEKRLMAVKDADIVGISIKSFTLNNAIELAHKVREINKKALLVCGGAHITVDGYDFFKKNDIFNVGIMYEGEYVIVELASGKKLEDIQGIVYRKNREIRVNPKKDWIQNLDEIPFPNYEVFDSETDKMPYCLVTSRGCPFSCTYCSVHLVSGKKWRSRSVGNIINELRYAMRRRKNREMVILDDNFSMNLDRAKEFCSAIIKENMKLKWSCPNGIRANRIDYELAKLMKKSGCYEVNLGIESGVETVFDRLKKGEKLQDVINAVSILKKARIKVIGFFIVGLMGSTFELDKKSIDFAKKLKLDATLWTYLVPYPKTELYEEILNDKSVRMLDDWRKGMEFGPDIRPIFETKDYSAKQRIKAYYLANLRTKTYGAFINPKDSFFKKIKNIIRAVIKYDFWYLPYHIFWAGFLMMKSKIAF